MTADFFGWLLALTQWVIGLDKPLALGLIILASIIAAIGYLVMRIGWRYWLINTLKKRQRNRKNLIKTYPE